MKATVAPLTGLRNWSSTVTVNGMAYRVRMVALCVPPLSIDIAAGAPPVIVKLLLNASALLAIATASNL